MRILAMVAAVLLHSSCAPSPLPDEPETEFSVPQRFTKLTPILLADDVAGCVEFWNALGLETTISVPGETGLVFAILSNGEVELMYQSKGMAGAENPAVTEGVNRSIIFMEVGSLDDILPFASEQDIVAPEHTTSYGAREIYIRDPAGNVIGFSEQGVAPTQ